MKPILATLVIALTTIGPAFPDVAASDIEVCRSAPTSECLADIGFAFGMRDTTQRNYNQSVDLLAVMGRTDEAHALQVWNLLVNGQPEAQAESHADWRLEAYRMIEALRVGADFDTTLENTSKLSAQNAFAQIAGMIAFGGSLGLEPTTDPDDLALIRRYVAHREAGDSKEDRVMAAEFLFYLGDTAAAADILRTATEVTGRMPTLSDGMIELIGVAEAERLFELDGPASAYRYLSLARATERPEDSLPFLQKALDVSLAERTNQARYMWMRSTVRDAAKLGHIEFAEDLAARLRREMKADDNHDRTVQGALVLSEALIAIDASNREIRRLLKRARKGMTDLPERDRGSVAFQLALRYAAIGDQKWSIRMIGMQDDQIRAWSVIASNWSEIWPDVLQAAHKNLNSDDMTALRAHLARTRAHQDKSPSDKAWALETAWDLVDATAPPIDEPSYFYYYDNLLKAAFRLENPALMEAVVDMYVADALETRSSMVITHAAYLLFQLEERDLR